MGDDRDVAGLRVVQALQACMQWSMTAIGLGFAMLAAGLGVSVRLRTR